ncbi:MAG: FtsX-like permease family protein [Vicinamibacterales bacterium]
MKRHPLQLKTLNAARGNSRHSTVFTMLGSAALCLLLIACANVASLELASVSQRARALSVQAALGASRGTLLRVRLFELAILLMASVAVGAAIATWGIYALAASLPPGMALELANAIDFDTRAVLFMLVVATATWALTSLPAAWRASRANLMDALRDDTRTMLGSRSAPLLRQALAVGQVAAAVVLLIGALLYARTYIERLGLDKGFDSRGLVTLQVLPAPNASLRGEPLGDALSGVLTAHPDVIAVARTDSFPPATSGWIGGPLTIDGGAPLSQITLSYYGVTPAYFHTLGIPLVAGRWFEAHDTAAKVVVDEAFARRFWPDDSAVGSRFRVGSTGIGRVTEFEIVGVAKHVRPDRTVSEAGRDLFVFYYPMSPSRGPVSFVARLRTTNALSNMAAAVSANVDRAAIRVETVDDLYARLEGDRRLATVATAGFGTLALLIATIGIYAVMAFMVSGRRREIGVRLALGATGADIRQLVFRTSLTFLVLGALAGLTAAAAASRFIASQLYGVSPIDPTTYGVVAATVVATGALATWYPARQAARVDPAVTLRSQ